jgi:hypothetical protein
MVFNAVLNWNDLSAVKPARAATAAATARAYD